MRFAAFAAFSAAAAMSATSLAAQDIHAGAVEIGAFWRYTSFDNNENIGDHSGFGGRLGYFFNDRLEGEIDASYGKSHDLTSGADVGYLPGHARLLYNMPAGSHFTFILGGGYTFYKYSDLYDGTEHGGGILLGARGRKGIFTARVDGTLDYTSSSVVGQGGSVITGLQLGLGVLFGGHEPKPEPVPAAAVAAPVAAAAVAAPPPPDDDHDGVLNTSDKCPNTPAGETVDANGCSPGQLDADNDKVPDAADKCPNTPAGEAVDANGCGPSQRDSDGDGVTDDKDKCPDTPAGRKVNESGCLPDLVLEGVNFKTNSAMLVGTTIPPLDRVAEQLNAYPETRIEIRGYTDNTGSAATNTKLSQARADAVKAYLVKKGVAADRLETKGFGPDSPMADNSTSAGRAKNRRVELHQLH